MQGKGIIKVFLVAMVLVSLLQYFYMLPTIRIDNAAEDYATTAAQNASLEEDEDAVYRAAKTAFLDSMSNEKIFSIPLIKDFTYQELKSRQLNLGLDLKGGMNVVLQVDLRDFILSLSKDSKDPTFLQALDAADERLKDAQTDYITLFAEEWNKIKGDKKLADIFAKNQSAFEGITFDTPDGEIIRDLQSKGNETVVKTYERLKEKIDQFGVMQPNVTLDEGRDLIIAELPGVDNPEVARKYLQASAKLEFRDVYRIDQPLVDAMIEADELLKAQESEAGKEEEYVIQTDSVPTIDSLSGDTLGYELVVDSIPLSETQAGPLLSKLTLSPSGIIMGFAFKNQTDDISAILERPEVKALFPTDVAFRWSRNPEKDETASTYNQHYLYSIRMDGINSKPRIDGENVINASSYFDDQEGQNVVNMTFDAAGTREWAAMTTDAYNDQQRQIAVLLDDRVVTAPSVNAAITNGQSRITGGFTVQEGQDLARVLEFGKLPAELDVIQENVVGPSLGKTNINRSYRALIGGVLIVLFFMYLYYSRGGLVAIIALFANLFFIFGALASFGTVLTLPGIAGIVLTIGMAVDANVIIFERIREELREGKSMKSSIADGFKNSYSAIIDANVTTLLTAFVLAYFGLGPIKGFAVVLIIGVLSSLFTAVLLGRLMIDWWVSKDRKISFWTSASKNWFANLNIDWLKKRRVTYIISGVFIAAGLVSFFTQGFDLGVDFKGGYSYNIQFEDDVDVTYTELQDALEVSFGEEPVVKAVDGTNTYSVVTGYLIDDNSETAPERVMTKLYEGVSTLVPGTIDYENFKLPDADGTHVVSSAKVGPTIADDIKKSSFYAGLFALLLIFLYIFIRFNKWQYSLGAVAALVHDSLIVLAVFSIGYKWMGFSMEIDQPFIAAILTVIGYSINDTVVVYDRIREYLGMYVSKSKHEVINMAVNSTVSRTVITSLTTLFVVLMLFIFGGGSIKGFAFALLIGIVVGTYSSIFVATPIMTDLTGEMKAKEATKKSSFSRSKVKTR